MLNITKEQAYANGVAAGKKGGWASDDMVHDVEEMFPQWKREAPLSAHLDFRSEIVKLWHERMNAKLDLAKYPECRGLADIVQAEYQGYLDGSGGNAIAAVYQYNWSYFLRLRLYTRYFGFPDDMKGQMTCYQAQAAECSAIYYEDSPDGAINGKNLDSSPSQRAGSYIPHHIPHGKPIKGVALMGTGSAGVLCDDEPEEIFPVNMDYILPADIKTVADYVPFRNRYRQFCGPMNGVFVDEQGASVAIEQSNTRMGWRFSTNGISAVTALSYMTPELQAFKRERDQLSLEKRGWGQDAPDWVYWRGCDARYRRLLKLVEAEGKRGPTLEGMAQILLDPNAAAPERISVANEKYHPLVDSNSWTIHTWVAVVFGPQRRTYHWGQPLEPAGPIFKLEPELTLGEGVDAKLKDGFADEWTRLKAIGKK